MKKRYGYVRVSSKDQCENRQLIALQEFPVSQENIFIDKLNGKDFHRPQYMKLIKKVKQNDVIVIKFIDRLGRNYEEILNQWRIIIKEKRVDIVVLDMLLLDVQMKKLLQKRLLQIWFYKFCLMLHKLKEKI